MWKDGAELEGHLKQTRQYSYLSPGLPADNGAEKAVFRLSTTTTSHQDESSLCGKKLLY